MTTNKTFVACQYRIVDEQRLLRLRGAWIAPALEENRGESQLGDRAYKFPKKMYKGPPSSSFGAAKGLSV